MGLNSGFMQKKERKNEAELIQDGLSKYGRRAYKSSLAAGHAPAVLCGNTIYTVNADGRKTKVASVKQARTKVSQYRFNIRKSNEKA